MISVFFGNLPEYISDMVDQGVFSLREVMDAFIHASSRRGDGECFHSVRFGREQMP